VAETCRRNIAEKKSCLALHVQLVGLNMYSQSTVRNMDDIELCFHFLLDVKLPQQKPTKLLAACLSNYV
jgi:hypothetical protein